MRSEILLAANRLPVAVEEMPWGWHFTESPGGLVSALKGAIVPFAWIGWPGMEIRDNQHQSLRDHLSAFKAHYRLEPVFVGKSETDLHYNGLSNRVIWPAFHGLTDYVLNRPEYWPAYRKVNETFAHRIFHHALNQLTNRTGNEPVRVWIHDYQLLLVPRILRRMLERARLDKEVRIGFFLHIPFPPDNDFELIPREIRNKLVDGVLGADLLGFHDAEYRGNFIRAAAQAIGAKQLGNDLTDGSRFCSLGIYPIGITPSHFTSALNEARGDGTLASVRNRYAGRKIILGVDRLDPAKGILQKLESYQRHLESNPGDASETCLVQIAVPSRTRIREYRDHSHEVLEKARAINQRFSRDSSKPPVDIRFESISQIELAAHYAAADVMLITSLRDGMNLVSLESVACQKDCERRAALVLSRSTGAARWLSGALKVNPRDPSDIATALAAALRMPDEERSTRAAANLCYVETRTADRWARHFIEDLSNSEAR